MAKNPNSGSAAHHVRRKGLHPYIKRPKAAIPKDSSWSVPDLCKAYDWPTTAPSGAVIAIIELGGGWTESDVALYFSTNNLPPPNITNVSVDGTQNSQCDPKSDADAEVALDIQVAGAAYAVATGQPANIRVYWSQDITKAIIAAASDGCDVCSISWGADEASWGIVAANALEQAAVMAAAAGMVVFAASGDNDSCDGGPTPANVDLPAAAPHVIGCGGTTATKKRGAKKPDNDSSRAIEIEEKVWNNNPGKMDGEGTGGGFSVFFPMPLWQANTPHGPGRMVPDVAANADPQTGYQIVLYAKTEIVGGTSAVAPLYAGLFASFGTKLGFVTPELYLNNACFNDVTRGNNGAYRASAGPDPCTGLGSPIAASLEDRLDPVTVRAKRLRTLYIENERFRATIAGFQVPGPRWGGLTPPDGL
jgi:kumamolisin